MVQNRNKLIDLLIGNLSNVVVHRVLEKAIQDELIRNKYEKEIINSLEIAKRYRDKINPINKSLPRNDVDFIKKKIVDRVRSELMKRISKGYANIDIGIVDEIVDDVLKDIGVC